MKTNCTTGAEHKLKTPSKYQNIPATSAAHRILKAEAASRGLLLKDLMTEFALKISMKNGAKL